MIVNFVILIHHVFRRLHDVDYLWLDDAQLKSLHPASSKQHRTCSTHNLCSLALELHQVAPEQCAGIFTWSLHSHDGVSVVSNRRVCMGTSLMPLITQHCSLHPIPSAVQCRSLQSSPFFWCLEKILRNLLPVVTYERRSTCLIQ